MWLHGGGYVIGSLVSHRHLVSEAGRAARMWALALDYRLAPEHPFPAAVEDAVSGYRYLLSRGIRPGHIAIAGDSAGGGLVVAAMLAIREAGLAQPACGWTPWVDMEAIGETMSTKAEADPMVQRPGLLEMAGFYLGGADPRSPLAAPIYADLKGPGAAADPSRRGGDLARRRDPAIQSRRRRRCPRRSADLARNGSCLAHVSLGADGREAGDPGGRRLHTRGDGGVASSNSSRTRMVETSFGLT
jgi:acetyl esterase/lipase